MLGLERYSSGVIILVFTDGVYARLGVHVSHANVLELLKILSK